MLDVEKKEKLCFFWRASFYLDALTRSQSYQEDICSYVIKYLATYESHDMRPLSVSQQDTDVAHFNCLCHLFIKILLNKVMIFCWFISLLWYQFCCGHAKRTFSKILNCVLYQFACTYLYDNKPWWEFQAKSVQWSLCCPVVSKDRWQLLPCIVAVFSLSKCRKCY